jgi:type IV pilus assembly protein PilW
MHIYQPVTRPLEKGFSLIEFMIAITISMIILLAVSIAWQSSLLTQKTQSDASRLNETVRFSIDLLSREIKQAGLINLVTKTNGTLDQPFCSTFPANSLSPYGGVIAGVNDPATIWPTDKGTDLTVATGTPVAVANLSDAIRVRYYGENTTAGQETGTGSGTEPTYDCLGNPVPNATLVEDTLYVAPDPNNKGEPALWCYSNNPNSTPSETGAYSNGLPMVAGVESLQILYGEDTDADGIVNHYIPWQLLNNGTPNSDNVLSVKISIVARSANPVSVGMPAGKVYYHFGPPPPSPDAYVDPGGTLGTKFTAPADNRLRLPQPLSTEIAVRNFSHC